jgi:hypothetical protein
MTKQSSGRHQLQSSSRRPQSMQSTDSTNATSYKNVKHLIARTQAPHLSVLLFQI